MENNDVQDKLDLILKNQELIVAMLVYLVKESQNSFVEDYIANLAGTFTELHLFKDRK